MRYRKSSEVLNAVKYSLSDGLTFFGLASAVAWVVAIFEGAWAVELNAALLLPGDVLKVRKNGYGRIEKMDEEERNPGVIIERRARDAMRSDMNKGLCVKILLQLTFSPGVGIMQPYILEMRLAP